jgi:tetratricopeptide (TPR) repeat protein
VLKTWPGLLLITLVSTARSEGDFRSVFREATRAHNAGRYDEAAGLYGAALRETGSSGVGRGTVLTNLGALYSDWGRYREAEEILLEACRLLADWPAGVADLATCHHNLGSVYRDQGKYDSAEASYLKAVSLVDPTSPEGLLSIAATRHSLGVLYRAMGKSNEAEAALVSALHIRERLQGPRHGDVAAVLKDIAEVRIAAGQFAAAEPLLWRALRIYEVSRPRPSRTAAVWSALASVSYMRGDLESAADGWERALGLLRGFTSEHPNVAVASYELGNVERALGRSRKAEEHLTFAVAALDRKLGPDHPHAAFARCYLALMYSDQRRFAEAEPLFVRGLAALEQRLGPAHWRVAAVVADMAKMYVARGEYARSEELYRRSIASYSLALGPEHPAVATLEKEYAVILRKLHRKREAREVEQRAAISLKPSGQALTVDVQQLGRP